mgnify:CR=1 FL=1
MDLRGIGFVLLLVLLSGIIAYIGDYVGRKIGKKRISLFGIRPKHTSIIVTIISGILILSVTLITLFAFSEYARKSFFGLQSIISELEDRKVELQESTEKYKEQEIRLRTEAENALEAYEQSSEKLKEKQAELDEILGKINLKSIELSEIHDSNQKLEKEYKKIEKETKELREKKKQLERDIEEGIERLSEVSVETLYGEILYYKDQLLARVIVSPDIKEDELKYRLTVMINAIVSESVERGAIVDKDAEMIFEGQFEDLIDVLRNSDNDVIVDALAANNVFKGQQMYIKLRPTINRIVFRQGDIIQQQTFPQGLSLKRVEEMLSEMLYMVSFIARNEGIMPDPETQRVGSISAKRYVEVAKIISESDRQLNVKIVTTQTTRVTDKLKIDLMVK